MSHEQKSVKRNHFRAAVSAKTRVILVDENQREHIRKNFDIPGLNEMTVSGDKTMSLVFSALVSILQDIDEKLDRINNRLAEQGHRKRELDVNDTVDISASGISLLLTEDLEKGQLLRLSICLPGYPFGRFETFGRVVRTVSKKNHDTPLYLTGIEFVGLTDDEKESLVKYTFSQQRKHIRASGNCER